jgi:hypothetical protein
VELPVKRNREKVASRHHQIRVQVIDDFHCISYWRRREILIVVKVAQLRDGETVESGGQPRECDFDRSYDRAVRLKKYGVFAERHNAGHGKPGGNFEKTFVWLQMANDAIPHLL